MMMEDNLTVTYKDYVAMRERADALLSRAETAEQRAGEQQERAERAERIGSELADKHAARISELEKEVERHQSEREVICERYIKALSEAGDQLATLTAGAAASARTMEKPNGE